ncbi:MAG TPA: hypothetical protein VGP02_00075 [Mycobacteriales bacterium]|nr:hypothetical protein [Mycobacteriales bacterium]
MPKSRSKALPRFGRPGFRMPRALGTGHVTVVDPGLLHSSLRRAKLGFGIAFLLTGATVKVGAASVTGQARSWLIGLVAGLAAGSTVWLLLFCWPVLRMTWHWLPELTAGAALLWAYSTLTLLTRPLYAVGVLALAACGPFTFGPARRRLTALGWCAIVRHRLRVCFAEFIRSAHADGRLPLILLARPTPAGERVWLWLRPGLSLGELEGRYDKIAVACWATEVRAVASGRWAALLQVDISRRNTLRAVVDSPLSDLVPTGTPAPPRTTDGLTPAFAAGLDLPDVPDPRHPAPAPRPRAPRPAAPSPAPVRAPDDTADWI